MEGVFSVRWASDGLSVIKSGLGFSGDKDQDAPLFFWTWKAFFSWREINNTITSLANAGNLNQMYFYCAAELLTFNSSSLLIPIPRSIPFSSSHISSSINCTCRVYHANISPSARAVFNRLPQVIQDYPALKYLHNLLQASWNREYTRVYSLISQVENGELQVEEPVRTMILDYKRA